MAHAAVPESYSTPQSAPQMYPEPRTISYQPGLEVVPGEYEYGGSKIAVPENVPKQVVYVQEGMEVSPNPQYAVASHEKYPADPRRNRSKIIIWALVGVIIVLLIVGGVVGGVLGSRLASGSGQQQQPAQGGTGGSGPTGTGNTQPAEIKNLRERSALAISGRKTSNGFESWLYYQRPDDKVVQQTFFTSRLPGGTDFGNWTAGWSEPVVVDARAEPNTPLTAETLVWYGEDPSHLQVYFIGTDKQILGLSFRENVTTAGGNPDSINGDNYRALTAQGGLGSYWPRLLAIAETGGVTEYLYGGIELQVRSLNFTLGGSGIKSTSGLKVLPLFPGYDKSSARGGYGVIYTTESDQMKLSVPDNSSSTWLSGFPTNIIVQGSSFNGFAQRGYLIGLDFFIVYQDKQGKIQVLQRLDAASPKWEGPRQYAAFDGADNPTEIACLTPNTYNANVAGPSGDEIRLGTNMTRCYFQSNRAIQEVLFTGTDFVKVGLVPTG